MTAASAAQPSAEAAARSTRLSARVAGGLYLLIILGGLFGEAVVLGRLTTAGDAAATAKSIAGNAGLWRAGLGVHLAYLAAAAPIMYVLLFRILRPFEPALAQMALLFAAISAAVEGAALLQLYVPLALIENPGALGGLANGEGEALGYLAIRLYESGFGFALLFFAGFCAATGLALVRSRLVPRAIGWLMVAAGACYFGSSLATVVAPDLARLLFPWILLPCLVGEASLALWLLFKSVDAVPAPGSVRGGSRAASRSSEVAADFTRG